MKNIKRYPEFYRIANKYARFVLGYENENMTSDKAFSLRCEVEKKLGLDAIEGYEIWMNELSYALKFWDVPVSELMACNS